MTTEPFRGTYGRGDPHRQTAHTGEAAVKQVRDANEWWVPIHFPGGDYLIKVDTGARVNVLSVADMSRLGYSYTDLKRSSVYLVGFNRAVVQPRGQLHARVRVNGAVFDTVFQVVEQCNSPLLCLRDAARAGLVTIGTSAQPEPVSEFGFYKDEIVSLTLKPVAVPKQFPLRKVPLALQAQAKS